MALSRGKQWVLAGLALMAIASALVFRRTSSQPVLLESQNQGHSHVALTRRLPPGHGTNERGQVLQSFDGSPPRLPTAATADPDAANREFSAHLDRAFHPGGGLFQRSEALEPLEGPNVELMAQASDEVGQSSGPRRHIVVDGDTLARLAARYLGSSERYGEIFAANRGVLTTPDLLPIGVELVIPPRQKPAPPAALTDDDQDRQTADDDPAMPRLDIELPPEDAAASQSESAQSESTPSASDDGERPRVPVPKPTPAGG